MELGDLPREDPVAAFRFWHALKAWHLPHRGRRYATLSLAAKRQGARVTLDQLVEDGCPRAALDAAGAYNLEHASERKLEGVVAAVAAHWSPPLLLCWDAVANIELENAFQSLELAGVRCPAEDRLQRASGEGLHHELRSRGLTDDVLDVLEAGIDVTQEITRQLAQDCEQVELEGRQIDLLCAVLGSASQLPIQQSPGIAASTRSGGLPVGVTGALACAPVDRAYPLTRGDRLAALRVRTDLEEGARGAAGALTAPSTRRACHY
jgi:hypothetical protein